MAGQLENKVALVTGGSSGIGRTSAMVFAREGAKVVVADIDVRGGEETASIIKEAGGDAIFIKTNVSKATEVEKLVSKTVDNYGRVDCAFNNAGILGVLFTSITDDTEQNWNRVIKINLKGIWLCMKYEISQMLKQGGGVIVNSSSVAGLAGSPTGPAYIASKHGVVGLTRAASVEYAQEGIRINAVCPGWINTPMTESYTHDDHHFQTRIIALHPIGRVGTSEEVAETVVWLCSDAASFVTGHAMVVDGGRIAQ
jgi:NAD(P)-dependent dehydrogenase (short-subunit alcohol dehydrogenase family)